MRLPKPIATGVKFQSRALGSVYTAAQIKAYAAKAVEAEREACARVCLNMEGMAGDYADKYAAAIARAEEVKS